MSTPKTPAAPCTEQAPPGGGSYTRHPDGSLTPTADTPADQQSAAPAPVTPKPSKE